ncbi:hypothetical protein E05_26400 [Plautia stali symbiont]|nr:hypothetical protein E05_26400 [Plautia stali symbiont]
MPYEQRGRVLVEASETVWASLTEEMTDREILRARLLDVIELDRDRVGQVMDFNILTVRSDVTLATVQRFLRKRKSMPDGTDKIFITDEHN